MGATTFETTGKGKTVGEAFQNARDQALWDYGHRGYTGSLAEKDDYVETVLPDGVEVDEFIGALMDGLHMWSVGDEPLEGKVPDWAPPNWEVLVEVYDSKWGPCVAIKTAPDEWTFCGWAST